jgi:hypothetical protein
MIRQPSQPMEPTNLSLGSNAHVNVIPSCPGLHRDILESL